MSVEKRIVGESVTPITYAQISGEYNPISLNINDNSILLLGSRPTSANGRWGALYEKGEWYYYSDLFSTWSTMTIFTACFVYQPDWDDTYLLCVVPTYNVAIPLHTIINSIKTQTPLGNGGEYPNYPHGLSNSDLNGSSYTHSIALLDENDKRQVFLSAMNLSDQQRLYKLVISDVDESPACGTWSYTGKTAPAGVSGSDFVAYANTFAQYSWSSTLLTRYVWTENDWVTESITLGFQRSYYRIGNGIKAVSAGSNKYILVYHQESNNYVVSTRIPNTATSTNTLTIFSVDTDEILETLYTESGYYSAGCRYVPFSLVVFDENTDSPKLNLLLHYSTSPYLLHYSLKEPVNEVVYGDKRILELKDIQASDLQVVSPYNYIAKDGSVRSGQLYEVTMTPSTANRVSSNVSSSSAYPNIRYKFNFRAGLIYGLKPTGRNLFSYTTQPNRDSTSWYTVAFSSASSTVYDPDGTSCTVMLDENFAHFADGGEIVVDRACTIYIAGYAWYGRTSSGTAVYSGVRVLKNGTVITGASITGSSSTTSPSFRRAEASVAVGDVLKIQTKVSSTSSANSKITVNICTD